MTDPKTKKWLVPITIVEYGRMALVEAATAAEAAAKVRDPMQGWEELTDATSFKVTLDRKPTVEA